MGPRPTIVLGAPSAGEGGHIVVRAEPSECEAGRVTALSAVSRLVAGRPSLGRRTPKVLAIGGVWTVTRLGLVVSLGLLTGAHGGPKFADVNLYHAWLSTIRAGHLPSSETTWQYPPGAALLFELPGLARNYYLAFVLMMLSCDLVTTVALVARSWRTGIWRGSCYWVLLLPVLGLLSVTRFDLVPTMLVVLAGSLGGMPVLAGALLGLGAYVKVWPIIGLVLMGNLRDLKIAAGAALGVLMAGAATSALAWHSALGGFLQHQTSRGLEIESVAGSLWFVAAAIEGAPVHYVRAYGSEQFVGRAAQVTAQALDGLWMVAFCVIAALVIRAYRRQGWSAGLGLDATWTFVLAFIVTSKVLSPQYLIWLVGVGALTLNREAARVLRPLAVATLAVAMTFILPVDLGLFIVARNVLLVAALVGAIRALGRARSALPGDPGGRLPTPLPPSATPAGSRPVAARRLGRPSVADVSRVGGADSAAERVQHVDLPNAAGPTEASAPGRARP